MAQTAFGLPQILSLYDPSVAVDQTALERQMAIAQMLRQQSMESINPNRQIGGMGYRVSPLEAVAKVLQAYQANRMDQQNDQARLALTQRMAMALRAASGEGDGASGVPTQAPAPVSNAGDASGLPAGVTPAQMEAGGFPQPQSSSPNMSSAPTVANTPAPTASAPGAPMPAMGQGNQFGMANLLRSSVIGAVGGDQAAAAYWANAKVPDAVKTLQMTGQNLQTVGDLNTKKLANEANAPHRLGPNIYADPSGTVHFTPTAIPGSMPVPDATAPGGYRYVTSPGASAALAVPELAKAGAKAAFTPYAGFDSGGHPAPLTSVANALRNYGGGAPASGGASPSVATVTPVPGQGPSATAMDGRLYGDKPLGTEAEQSTIDKHWAGVSGAASKAQTTKSYLDNILNAAQSGAIIGPNADRRELIHGFIYLAGIKESQEDRALSQTQLLDKYHDQIVTGLGQGGLGTDAARALLDTAYPGKHMNLAAIREAVANLNGAQDMAKAEAKLLLPLKTARNSAAYQQAAQNFELNADPRIFQWMSIQNPDARKAFLTQALQQDPTFLDRAKALRAMGALQ